MNRTDRSLKPLKPSLSPSASYVESGLFSEPSHDTSCAVFAPLHYEPGYAYPLIVWLHGEGSDERQLLRVMPLVSMRNYVALAPRGIRLEPIGKSGNARYGWRQSEHGIRQAEHRIFSGIEEVAEKFNINRQRVFVAGFDCGGTMAFRVAMDHPSRFAGVLSFCGAFPHGHNPLGNLTASRQLAIFLAAGRHSRQYPATAVCENLRLFHTAGLSTTLREYPCGQELAPQMLADMDRWIIEQFTSSEPSTAESDESWSNEMD